jgi:hypothetical protein
LTAKDQTQENQEIHMQKLSESKLTPPPFDDPRYIARCNQAWREEFRRELIACRDRWKAIISACLAGDYGRAVREEWQGQYPGCNPDSLLAVPLMQAAQAVWAAKGSKCVERLPDLRMMAGDVDGQFAVREMKRVQDVKQAVADGERMDPDGDWNPDNWGRQEQEPVQQSFGL